MRTIAKCDFCGRLNVPHGQDYKCESYESKLVPYTEMIAEWVACDECERFIENNDWEGLADYCARKITESNFTTLSKSSYNNGSSRRI